MEVSAAAQTAAIAGIGMLYCGTAHRLMAEFLLGEIACCSRGDRMRDREAYTLSAGLALGLVTLGKGSSNEAAGLGDLEIAQRLHHALAGGTGSRLGQISSLLNSTVGQDNYLCEERVCNSRVRDGEYLNTDLTAPGATLALGLYFIQTNSTAAAARLRLPDTGVLIDSVRPDFMLLRVISRGLILWDFIRPTTEWVEAQLPSVLVDSMQALLAVKYSLKSAARSNIFRRCMCRSSRSKMRAKVLFCKCSCKKELPLQDPSDWSTIKQAHANIVAGGCFVRMCVTYQQNFSIYL
jgi:anaphase-promoting complex subunit 1